MTPGPATIPPQPGENARWWARRWYKNASQDERAAMLQLLTECGTGAVQQAMNFDGRK